MVLVMYSRCIIPSHICLFEFDDFLLYFVDYAIYLCAFSIWVVSPFVETFSNEMLWTTSCLDVLPEKYSSNLDRALLLFALLGYTSLLLDYLCGSYSS